MSKTKKWLIIASCLILIGCIVFGGVMAMQKWDFTKLSTNKFETSNHEINENFKSISIITKTSDVVFVSSENSKYAVECYEQKNVKHSVAVKDGTLVIEAVDTRKWYEHIGINFGTPRVTVYIPKGEYGTLSVKANTGDVEIPQDFDFASIDISVSTGDVKCYASALELIKIKASTGDINADDISCSALDLTVSTGKVNASGVSCKGDVTVSVSTGKAYLTNIACNGVTSSGNTGDISLKNVVAKERISIERSTGNVKFEGCDAGELFVTTDTGDVTGSLLSDKIFVVNTDTGKKEVPKTTTGGICEISTDTGDIIITIQQ